MVWLLEHPPVYTAGVSARAHDLLAPDRLPVFEVRRGGTVPPTRPRPAGGLRDARPRTSAARRCAGLRRRAGGGGIILALAICFGKWARRAASGTVEEV